MPRGRGRAELDPGGDRERSESPCFAIRVGPPFPPETGWGGGDPLKASERRRPYTLHVMKGHRGANVIEKHRPGPADSRTRSRFPVHPAFLIMAAERLGDAFPVA